MQFSFDKILQPTLHSPYICPFSHQTYYTTIEAPFLNIKEALYSGCNNTRTQCYLHDLAMHESYIICSLKVSVAFAFIIYDNCVDCNAVLNKVISQPVILCFLCLKYFRSMTCDKNLFQVQLRFPTFIIHLTRSMVNKLFTFFVLK